MTEDHLIKSNFMTISASFKLENSKSNEDIKARFESLLTTLISEGVIESVGKEYSEKESITGMIGDGPMINESDAKG